MLDELRVNDAQLQTGDIRRLENADEVAHLFARLGYDVDNRSNITNYDLLGLGSEDMGQHIHKIELLGQDPVDGDIIIYLFEVRSVTAKLRNDIARRFRERPESALLVLTKDYEELEFVLLERTVARSRSLGKALKQTIRPIPLTVNRLNPDPVHLRVLKRFTFTETDAGYQWEKLRSAYMLAEWSEEYFNNRALFSDYYLKNRLTDPQLTPEWSEDVLPIGRKIYQHLISARQDYSKKTEDVIRRGLYEPLFKDLGFEFEEQKLGSSSEETADYLLYTPGDRSEPISAALTYVWNRNLDDVDEARERAEEAGGTPFEIPGAIVVSLLEEQVVPWVIVTNGKLWRLYSATASNKATNYYEVDLEEAINATDQLTALKYWWLLFWQPAFTGFLDDLLKRSADYAKELGERLKDRVFVEIFPQFARGFIADMRAKGVTTFDEAALAGVFSGTMTFLYRLMFILYAESLDLLPVYDVRGYQGLSLYRLKHEIAEAGGTVQDEAPDKLGRHYKQSNTELYERLQTLFGAIDLGSDTLNLPTYNGGLFSPDTLEGTFLSSYAVPDRYLALGLDRLARDVDDKTQALGFIDFKSLGVRQLGSIYEGLLEFKLNIAKQKLAVTKSKGREVYQPAKKVKKPLAVISKGDVYLENDKRERKATGSYYTPDYIVKYIVRHTVGPVLERKFKELAPRLRDAQKNYRHSIKQAEARRQQFGYEQSPYAYWNERPMRQLVDDCLDVRVLDPAMGSGHFLVEVVDYLSNRLIDFLNAWSENPVWGFLAQTREEIMADMDRQGVTIDPDRLTRVSLLKRAVLKRCVYGVDLNPMAVELAKVSLWLDAFTLGAPLSFLDHHLKCGNSLIGARITEVQDYLSGGGGPIQLDMFSGSEFAGIMLATDLMRQVSYLSDNTPEQARESAQAFRDARDHLAPYKRMLDVYTSRWFGNASPKGVKTDRVLLFLKQDDVADWLKDPARLLDDSLIPASQLARTALQAATEKRFFHWELEFPEVFFAPSAPGEQDVQLLEDGGFDAVVGNPPYFSISTLSVDEQMYLKEVYDRVYAGNSDILYYFLSLVTRLPLRSGILGFIVARYFQESKYARALREYLSERARLLRFVDFQNFQVFGPSVNVLASLVFLVRREGGFSDFISLKLRDDTLPEEAIADGLLGHNSNTFEVGDKYFVVGDSPWFFKGEIDEIDEKIKKNATELNKIATVVQSMQTGRNTILAPPQTVVEKYRVEESLLHPIAKSGSITRYEFEEIDTTLIWTEGIELDQFPNAREYLMQFKEDLARRYDIRNRNAQWWEIANPRSADLFFSSYPRILVPFVATSNKFCVDDAKRLNDGGDLRAIFFDKDTPYSEFFICSILNSYLMDSYHKRHTKLKRGGYYEYFEGQLSKLPIRSINFSSSTAERERLTQAAIAAYDQGDHAALLQRVQQHLTAKQTDVIHDLLAHLAGRMIDLNKEKQAEIKRFLGWLEDRLAIRPNKGKTGLDALTGRTIIQNYLGDYQKGEGELPWQKFYYRLHQNRRRYGVPLSDVEGEIQTEFETSLATLRPLKQALARTDALIDKIVYRLYGLTDEEIELIERPQYEQALTEAKAAVVSDDKIADEEERLDEIAKNMLPAAKRFFERVEPLTIEEQLDRDLPGWRLLSPDAPTFLLTGDYNLGSLPEQMDFSVCVIPYTKAVETVIQERIFTPFRDTSGNTDADCKNKFLAGFMRGEKKLTLGSFSIILSSSKEKALRAFVGGLLADIEGLVAVLNDETMLHIRNKAAHDEVLSRTEAEQIRGWAMAVLEQF